MGLLSRFFGASGGPPGAMEDLYTLYIPGELCPFPKKHRIICLILLLKSSESRGYRVSTFDQKVPEKREIGTFFDQGRHAEWQAI